ncbi:MAG: outer membrane beta-barrel protein, partial [Verrucomicrobia bacterium]|nr:outer membrane beta-barrel protein [Verrucomicrobiota bacterium]
MKLIYLSRLLISCAAAFGLLASAAPLALYADEVTSASAGARPSPSPSPASDGKKVEKAVVEQPKPPESRFKLYGWIEGGITGNPDSPEDNHNFGHLFTDRANEPLLNQASIVAERTLDPNATGFDWAFKGWFMVGSDSRYTKSSGFLDRVTDSRVQIDIPELWVTLHAPIPATAGGLDFKIGKYADPMSAETIDPRSNVFYSHSYIFNFGVPLTDTGFLATLHATKFLDLYAGVNMGANISFDDNNSSVAFEGGFGLNLLDGNLTVAALTHIGPENADDNHDQRFYNDITTTWKINKALTSITDLNLVHDQIDRGHWAYGVAQYFTYSFTDWFQLGIRGEVYWDRGNFFVGQFAGPNNEYDHLVLRGETGYVADPRTVTGGH